MKSFLSMLFLFAVIVPGYAETDVEYELKARFVGRSGAASENRRVNEHALRTPIGPGPKTGCHGDTLSVGVTINSADVSINGSVATIRANYTGKYTRQGWITPCVQSPPPNGHEDRNVVGTISFSITQIPFKIPVVSWLGVSNLGEVGDPGHDSNIFAIRAAKNAISSAF